MKRTIHIRTRKRLPKIEITARIDTKGQILMREEVDNIVEALTDNLVDALRGGIPYSEYNTSQIQIVK